MTTIMIGGSFLSAGLQVLFDRMATHSVINFFSGQDSPINKHLRKLRIALQSVNAVLEDAEEKQVTNPAVKEWLDELKDAVYDADDILDEIATATHSLQSTAAKVRNSISTALNDLVDRINPDIKGLLERLEALAKQKDDIGLREGSGGGKSLERFPTTSLVKESDIFGRDADKEAIIKLLLSDDASSPNHMGVIAITGMGGVGKTTLAQIVYNDIRVKQHFEFDAWVCVSYEFDVFRLTKTILEAVTSHACEIEEKNLLQSPLKTSLPQSPLKSSQNCEIDDLNLLQNKLKDMLMGKRFLLVLDDVWNEIYAYWELLSCPFRLGALASRVIVTTRNGSVASTMRSVAIHHLKELSDDHCWSIFAKHAFHSHNSDAEAYSEREKIGRQIVEKCKGLPLAAKAIGSLLWSKQDVDEWHKILKSKLWDLPNDGRYILPALRLSYQYLPSCLKRCFAYCSIFPKDYVFHKDQLVLLWMGEGFLQESENKTVEEVGDEYFQDLVSRSLFKQSSDNSSHFVMHDLVHDLAIFVSGQLSTRLEGDYSQKILNKARHLSYLLQNSDCPEVLSQAKRLRTFILLNTAYLSEDPWHKLFSTLTCLRVVSLSRFGNITSELVKTIFKIKHIRYLDISHSKVKELPDSICELYNLQTLKLSNCTELDALPKDMGKLINLRHLDLSFTLCQGLSGCMHELCNLQMLNLSGCRRFAELPTDMRKLTNLRHLDLSGTKITGIPDSLCELCNLQTLKLSGCQNLEKLPKEMKKLSHLCHLDITETKIKEMPRELGTLKCLRTLTTFIVSNTTTGSCIGELGRLKYLRGKLSILELQNVQYSADAREASLKNMKHLEELVLNWDEPNISGDQTSVLDGLKPHTNLKCLTIKCYSGPSFPDWVGSHLFSELATLDLTACKYCLSLPPLWQLPRLKNLSIVGFDKVTQMGSEFYGDGSTPINRFQVLTVLKLENMQGWKKWLPSGTGNEDGNFPHLRELCIKQCPELTAELPINLPCLAKLEINGCPRLVTSFPMIPAECELQLISCKEDLLDRLPTIMQKLVVKDFQRLESIPDESFANSKLDCLGIRNCSNLQNIPRGGLLSTLKKLEIANCDNLNLPMQNIYPSLEKLLLTLSCGSLESFQLEFFPKLSDIRIDGCKGLKALTTPAQHEVVIVEMAIEFCPQFECFPSGGLCAPLLRRLSVKNCGSLRSLPDNMQLFFPSLEKLQMYDCPKMNSVPEGGWPCNLNSGGIRGCGIPNMSWEGSF